MKREKIAFGSVPKDGGTFTFYRNLREPLSTRGIDLLCVSVGNREAALWEDSFADETCVLLAQDESNIKKQSKCFVEWCEQNEVDIVFGVNSIAILSALPHLPSNIRLLSRCANAFDHGYRITMSSYERLSRIVALAPGQIDTLEKDYGADRSRIALIPNGTSIKRFSEAASVKRGTKKSLRLGFIGRLEHKQKGVLFVPGILNELKQRKVDFNIKIAGKGIHEAQLRKDLSQFVPGDYVTYSGALKPEEIADFLAEIDVLIFPSQFEGSPNVLIEALMAGCVPVGWNVEGIIDYVIKHEQTGFLAPMGDCSELAQRITVLARDRELLAKMSRNAVIDARERFSRDRVVRDYVQLIRQVMKEPLNPYLSKPWNSFQVDPAFHQPLFKRLIPQPVKRLAKKYLVNRVLDVMDG